jgi:translation initiation factor IF-2
MVIKMRVHELAKELKMENKDLLKMLEKMGLGVKTVHSTLEEADAERVKNQINLSKKEGVTEQRVKPTVIRRRVKREEAAETPETPETQTPAVAAEEAPRPVEQKRVETPAPPAEAKPVQQEPPPAPAPAPAPPAQAAPPAPAAESLPPPAAFAQPAAKTSAPPAAGPAAPAPVEKQAPPKPPIKPKKKHEPAKIIERPAVPPPTVVRDMRAGARPERAVITPAGPKPPIILQRPAAPGAPRPATEEDERGRRRGAAAPGRGRAKKDVQVMEEGKPQRVRFITTKKRSFKEYEYWDERGEKVIVSGDREGRGIARGRGVRQPEITTPKAIKRKIRIAEAILVGELAKRMGVKGTEVIKKLMDLGLMATLNQAIDADAAALVATEFGYEVEKTGLEIEDLIEEQEEQAEQLTHRPPVVTIMGHVDHGKTSLLDAIRQTNVTAGEAGGITQHIGAYEVNVDHRKVVFLDTPGHEAFTAMRARGAQVTDIVILVVAADDGVMTQTVEAINHAKAAKVPIIVAINKIDKPNSNPERVKQALTEYGLVPEAWGGETIFAEISAKQKIGLKELLEMILLQAEVLELKANPERLMSGTVVEAKLDKGRGAVATVLVQNGTLHVGDAFVCGTYFGRVRAMTNDRGERIEEAGPSIPVEVIGFSGIPNAGDDFVVVTDERRAKDLANQRLQKHRELELSKTSKVSLEDFYKKMQKGVVKDLTLILKADVQGSVEALAEALNRLSTDAVHVNILHTGVGEISESDSMLAAASEAIILGFNVRTEPQAQALADQEKVDIRLYSVIYEALEDVHKAMEGLLEPIFEERFMGRAEVRKIFNISRIGVIAGSYVKEGKIVRGSKGRLMRDGKMVYEGNISSLKIMKDDQKEVAQGFECGITLGNFNDIKENDIIESYVTEKVTAHL